MKSTDPSIDAFLDVYNHRNSGHCSEQYDGIVDLDPGLECANTARKCSESQDGAAICIRGGLGHVGRLDTVFLLPLDGQTLHVRARHPERPQAYHGRSIWSGPASKLHGCHISPVWFILLLRVQRIVVARVDGFRLSMGESFGRYYSDCVVVAVVDSHREEDAGRGRGTEERIRECLG